MPSRVFSLRSRLKSFEYALRGVLLMLKSQHNAWLHATGTILVVLTGRFFGLTSAEWCWLVLAIMAVWTAEALNTALEFLADVASPEFHPLIEKAKDVAAGAVLISATGSVVIALLVLGPHFKGAISPKDEATPASDTQPVGRILQDPPLPSWPTSASIPFPVCRPFETPWPPPETPSVS